MSSSIPIPQDQDVYRQIPGYTSVFTPPSPHEPYIPEVMEHLPRVPPSPNDTHQGSEYTTPDQSPTVFFNRHRSKAPSPSKNAHALYRGRKISCWSCCSCNKVKIITALFLMVGGFATAAFGGWQAYFVHNDDVTSMTSKWSLCLLSGVVATFVGGLFCVCCVPPGTCSETFSCCCCDCCTPDDDNQDELSHTEG